MDEITKTLRTLVSRDKYRYQQDGYDLDLTYITERVIAMGLPGEGLVSVWRNDLKDVTHFLRSKHTCHYRIFNLSEENYDYSRLSYDAGTVMDLGWPDHHPPPLWLLVHIVVKMEEWLAQHPNNVAVVHCKAGRGRTGTVISSYLLKSGLFSEPEDALNYFASTRSAHSEGVTSPSQQRYVHYFARCLGLSQSIPSSPSGLTPICLPPTRKKILQQIKLKPLPRFQNGFTPVVEVVNCSRVPYCVIYSTAAHRNTQTCFDIDTEATLEINCAVEGDIMVRIYHHTKVLSVTANLLVCRFSFHTSFLPEQNIMILRKPTMEGERSGPLKDSRVSPATQVHVTFADYHPSASLPHVNRSTKPAFKPLPLPPSPPPLPSPHSVASASSHTTSQSPAFSSPYYYGVSPTPDVAPAPLLHAQSASPLPPPLPPKPTIPTVDEMLSMSNFVSPEQPQQQLQQQQQYQQQQNCQDDINWSVGRVHAATAALMAAATAHTKSSSSTTKSPRVMQVDVNEVYR